MAEPTTSCAFCRHLKMGDHWPPKCKNYPRGIPKGVIAGTTPCCCSGKDEKPFEPSLLGIWVGNIKKEARRV